MIKSILQKPDILGAVASSLCVVHCLATPFIFIAHSCSVNSCSNNTNWWTNLDFVFLTISFFAIKYSVKNTSKEVMKLILWSNWFILCLLVVNEKIQLITLSKMITHIVALTLAIFHIYNIKYCKCKANKCCA